MTVEEGLPPLDAGAGPAELEPLPEEVTHNEEAVEEKPATAATEPEVEVAEAGQEKEEVVTEAEEGDDEILGLVLGDKPEAASVPAGISPEDWAEFQKFKESKTAPASAPKEDIGSIDPATLAITEEDFGAVFSDAEGLQNVLSKAGTATRRQVHEDMTRAIEQLDGLMTRKFEQMIHLHDATKDHPELTNYPEAFRAAMAKASAGATPGDLRTPVYAAVDMLKRELGRAEKIRNTKRLDVRGKQTAPQAAGSSNRALNADKKKSDDTGVGFLGALYGVGV